jgi:hypothetical protein
VKQFRSTRNRSRGLTALAAAVALSGAISISAATPAAAIASNCVSGPVNSTKAWGQCRSASGGWGGFKLTVNCYYWPQQSAYGQAPQTIWASCPSWSRVTGIFIVPASY